MYRGHLDPRRLATAAGYLLLGAVVTAAVALGLLALAQTLQPAAYHAVYLRLGPGDATEFAVLVHVVVAAEVGLGVALASGQRLSGRPLRRAPLVAGVGTMAGLLGLFVVVSVAGVVGLPVALVTLLLVGAGVPLLLRLRYDDRSGGLPAFVGGVPVVVFLLLLAGFGLGWGWGYVLTAETVDSGAVGDAPVADLGEVPEVRDDLLSDDCSGTGEGGRVCYLELRGYEHEVAAARFLARHGVGCPYRGSGDEAGSFLAEDDGTVYRVSCGGHGD